MPSISVVIPTLGTRNDKLIVALESVSRQDVLPVEVIIVNNGSGVVDTSSICSNLRINVYEIPIGSGVAVARNFGASVAHGEVICFLDDDDFWMPRYLFFMSEQIQDPEVDYCVGRLDQFVNGRVSRYKQLSSDNWRVLLAVNTGVTGSNVAVRREIFRLDGGYDPKLPPSEDKDLVYRAFFNGRSVAVVHNAIAVIRQHDGSDRLSVTSKVLIGRCKFFMKHLQHYSIIDFMNWLHQSYKILGYGWLKRVGVRYFK